jgi:5-formyltetrahydrofolate cyclo-ligase
MCDSAQIRRTCRRARRALSPREQHHHSLGFVRQARRIGWLWRARQIAAYLAADGELDPAPLFPLLVLTGKRLYLPVLRPPPQQKLWFARHFLGGPLRLNRFAIPEPPLGQRDRRPPWRLDTLLLPLVAFDAACNRLGMGGGFYDRTLAHLRGCQAWRRPRLIGVAHECQKVEALPVRPWDIPLDLVITERRVYGRASVRWAHGVEPSAGGHGGAYGAHMDDRVDANR